jgi:hypothetical protein
MKTLFFRSLLPCCLMLASALPGRAQNAPLPPPQPRVLSIVVSEMLDRRAEGFATFSAIQKVFLKTFTAKKWPLSVTVDRFASNNPDEDFELQVFFKRLYYETPGVLTLSAWVTFYDHGKEHDFGMLKYQLNQGPVEHRGDAFEVALHGMAELAAAKIEPIIFPKASGALAASRGARP